MAEWKRSKGEGIEYMRWAEASKEIRDKVPEEEHKHAELGDFHYFTRKWQDGTIGIYRVPKAEWKEEFIQQKKGGSFGGGKGGPRHPIVEAFAVATTLEEVNALILSGFQPVWSDNGLQVGTFARANKDDPANPDVVNGLFMIKPKKAE